MTNSDSSPTLLLAHTTQHLRTAPDDPTHELAPIQDIQQQRLAQASRVHFVRNSVPPSASSAGPASRSRAGECAAHMAVQLVLARSRSGHRNWRRRTAPEPARSSGESGEPSQSSPCRTPLYQDAPGQLGCHAERLPTEPRTMPASRSHRRRIFRVRRATPAAWRASRLSRPHPPLSTLGYSGSSCINAGRRTRPAQLRAASSRSNRG